jgi:TetR/AcrR family transcriptional regulator, cholesterol catabolism regulator
MTVSTTTGLGAPSTRTPPASQRARRERILDAAVELATEGGYDAVQMREVAERADVALGTLYRYFPSKVHLLVSAMGRTFQSLQDSVQINDDASRTPEERVYRVVAAVTRYLAKNRRLSGAMIKALMMADADAGKEVDAVGDLMVGFITSASHEPGSTPTERDALIAHIIGKVWLTDVLTLLSRRMTVSAVLEDLEASIALVMSAPKPASPPRLT